MAVKGLRSNIVMNPQNVKLKNILFNSKKKTMTDELPIGESLKDGRLFIPCLHDDIERIVKGNICDSRIILNNRPFGPGYYFTSNASSCIQWCREHYPHSRLSLIVCQVLLGTYTQGSPGLREFPRRANGRFYDSLVDNKDDPCVFVVENVDQCYPAFVIDFASTTVESTAAMLQGLIYLMYGDSPVTYMTWQVHQST